MTLGYNKKFISTNPVELPQTGANFKKSGLLLKYTHFSVCLNIERRLPIFCAVNIDGTSYQKSKRGRDKWNFDERVLQKFQLGQAFYSGTEQTFHRGHIVRRLDPCWGHKSIAKKAELDTFHFTNCCP